MKYIYREREIVSGIEMRKYVILENFNSKYKKKKIQTSR